MLPFFPTLNKSVTLETSKASENTDLSDEIWKTDL